MEIRPIRTDEDLTAAFARIEVLMDAAPGSDEEAELDVLATLVARYEDQHYPTVAMDPVEFLKGHMGNTGRNESDLAAVLYSASDASDILNRRMALTLPMIRRISAGWHVPVACLIDEYDLEPR